jgi:hypothetical protein
VSDATAHERVVVVRFFGLDVADDVVEACAGVLAEDEARQVASLATTSGSIPGASTCAAVRRVSPSSSSPPVRQCR